MYHKRKFDKRYLIIIVVVVLAILLVILSLVLKKDRDLSLPEKIVKDSGTFVVNILSTPVNFIKEKVRESKEKNQIYNDYKELDKQKKSINRVKAENNDLKSEVKKLKEELKLDTILSDKIFTHATIINRNIDYWYEEVTIDKGKKKGLEKGMVVINSKGVIGTISKVSGAYSTVKLLSNENMRDKISVKISTGDNYVYGLISGYNTKNNTYTVEGISENKEISKGAEVVTTGMGGLFPSGLLIGKVSKVTTDNFDLSKVAVVKSAVNFDEIDYVSVLKRKDSK